MHSKDFYKHKTIPTVTRPYLVQWDFCKTWEDLLAHGERQENLLMISAQGDLMKSLAGTFQCTNHCYVAPSAACQFLTPAFTIFLLRE